MLALVSCRSAWKAVRAALTFSVRCPSRKDLPHQQRKSFVAELCAVVLTGMRTAGVTHTALPDVRRTLWSPSGATRSRNAAALRASQVFTGVTALRRRLGG